MSLLNQQKFTVHLVSSLKGHEMCEVLDKYYYYLL